MTGTDLTGPGDYAVTLAERGYVVIDDVLSPAAVLDPVLDADQELGKLNRWDPEAPMCA